MHSCPTRRAGYRHSPAFQRCSPECAQRSLSERTLFCRGGPSRTTATRRSHWVSSLVVPPAPPLALPVDVTTVPPDRLAYLQPPSGHFEATHQERQVRGGRS